MSVAAEEIQRQFTADEFWRLPDNGTRQELVKGVVCEMSPPGAEHGAVASNLHVELGYHVRSNALGRVFSAETGFLIHRDPDTVRAPDCAFLSRARAPDPLPKEYCGVVPDLVVEVVSPSDSAEDVTAKAREWVKSGARLVWVVYPGTRTVAVHGPTKEIALLQEGDTLSGGDVVPGFEMPVVDVFE